ncbi:MAG: hypothetical protein ACXWGV_12400, partial [Solirubrobacterales bacterium]
MAGRWRLALAVLAAMLPAAPPALANPPAETGKLIFVRDSDSSPTFNTDVHSMDADGSNRVNLAPGLPGAQLDPAISPDGRLILFSEDVDPAVGVTNNDIFVMRSDGSGVVNLTPGNPLSDRSPAFSPDGRSIAFARDVDPAPITTNTDIFVMGADGSGPIDLTAGSPTSDFAPDFAPDGRRIAFARDVEPGSGSSGAIFTMGVDGSAPLQITSGAADDGDPAFSPDGKRIAFARGPLDQLHASNADGSSVVNLTPTFLEEALGGAWAPDGKRIAFDDDGNDVYVVALAGGGIANLTNDTVFDSQPTWEYVYRCAGRRATIVGDDGPDTIKGTKKADVIVANAGKDRIRGRGGNDRI